MKKLLILNSVVLLCLVAVCYNPIDKRLASLEARCARLESHVFGDGGGKLYLFHTATSNPTREADLIEMRITDLEIATKGR